jgi:hypothetical protein
VLSRNYETVFDRTLEEVAAAATDLDVPLVPFCWPMEYRSGSCKRCSATLNSRRRPTSKCRCSTVRRGGSMGIRDGRWSCQSAGPKVPEFGLYTSADASVFFKLDPPATNTRPSARSVAVS